MRMSSFASWTGFPAWSRRLDRRARCSCASRTYALILRGCGGDLLKTYTFSVCATFSLCACNISLASRDFGRPHRGGVYPRAISKLQSFFEQHRTLLRQVARARNTCLCSSMDSVPNSAFLNSMSFAMHWKSLRRTAFLRSTVPIFW